MKKEDVKIVESCADCPFCNHDSEYGSDGCNLNTDILMQNFHQMPKDFVHNDCPLKNCPVIVKLKP